MARWRPSDPFNHDNAISPFGGDLDSDDDSEVEETSIIPARVGPSAAASQENIVEVSELADIDQVMECSSCTWSDAVNALMRNNHDVGAAILAIVDKNPDSPPTRALSQLGAAVAETRPMSGATQRLSQPPMRIESSAPSRSGAGLGAVSRSKRTPALVPLSADPRFDACVNSSASSPRRAQVSNPHGPALAAGPPRSQQKLPFHTKSKARTTTARASKAILQGSSSTSSSSSSSSSSAGVYPLQQGFQSGESVQVRHEGQLLRGKIGPMYLSSRVGPRRYDVIIDGKTPLRWVDEELIKKDETGLFHCSLMKPKTPPAAAAAAAVITPRKTLGVATSSRGSGPTKAFKPDHRLISHQVSPTPAPASAASVPVTTVKKRKASTAVGGQKKAKARSTESYPQSQARPERKVIVIDGSDDDDDDTDDAEFMTIFRPAADLMCEACEAKNLEELERLIKIYPTLTINSLGTKSRMSALMTACFHQWPEGVKYLLHTVQAVPNLPSRIIKKAVDGASALIWAVKGYKGYGAGRRGRGQGQGQGQGLEDPCQEIMRVLLNKGARPDDADHNGRTALLHLCGIALGLKLFKRDDSESGLTPMMSMITLLLNSGANPNQKWCPPLGQPIVYLQKEFKLAGKTPLILLVESYNITSDLNPIVAFFLACKDKTESVWSAKVDAQDHGGWTALSYAVHFGLYDLSEYLCKKGADPLCKALSGQTPYQLAQDKEKKSGPQKEGVSIVKLLNKYRRRV